MSKAFKHQTESLKFMKNKERVFDASSPGTGKTYVEIMDFSSRKKGKALIIAPKSLLHSAWETDFRKFAPHIKTSVARADNREAAFKTKADVYITNTDAVRWLVKQKPAFFKEFDTLIVDESSAFKHHTSSRSKALAKLTKHFKWRRLMSGTPNSNGITDLWHQYLLLDDGQRLGKSFYAFRAATCIPEQVGPKANMVQWVDKPGIENVVGALIKDITIRHKFEDCVDIPPNYTYARTTQLSRKHMSAYQEMEAFSIAQLKENKSVTAVNGAVLYGKLLQMASGAVYDDEGGYTLIDSERYELAIDLAEEVQQCVVFFLWQHQKDEIIKEAVRRGLSYCLIDGTVTRKGAREEAVEGFQKGFFRICFAHPKSAGHGLTLTKGTRTIWASPTHDLEWWKQGNQRIYRIGQKEKTETIVIVAEGTKDEHVWDRLINHKDMKMSTLLKELEE